MATAKRKQQMREVCDQFTLREVIPNILCWEREESRYGLALTAQLHQASRFDHDVVISVYIAWNSTFSDIRLMFLGVHSQYANRKFKLREKLYPQLLEEFERACIATDHFSLFVEEVRSSVSEIAAVSVVS